jgi:hypothetical protein
MGEVYRAFDRKFERAVARCLDRSVKDRLRDIGEARFLLAEPAAQPAALAHASHASRFWIPWAAAVLLATAAAAVRGFGYYRATRLAPLKPMVRLDMELDGDISLLNLTGAGVFKISVDGGPPTELTQAVSSTGNSWGPEGSIIHGTVRDGLCRIRSTGGTPQQIAQPDGVDAGPQVLPRRRQYPFQAGERDRCAAALRKKSKTLGLSGGSAHCVSSGHLLYLKGSTMFAVPFDLNRMEVSGEAVPLFDDVLVSPVTGEAHYAVSDTGTLIYRKTRSEETALGWVDAPGKREASRAKPGIITHARLAKTGGAVDFDVAPDGRLLLVTPRAAPGVEAADHQIVYI